MKKTRNLVMTVLVGCLSFGAYAVEPTVSDVVVRQRWPWSRLVNIDYVLTCDSSNRCDITITAYNGGAQLTLSPESLSGDLQQVAQGMRRIVWDPMKSAYTNQALTQFYVEITPALSPSYMIVDLNDGSQEFRYDWDTPWLDITNQVEYMTEKLVLKHIPAGTYWHGSPTNELNRLDREDLHRTTLTEDYYLGVFEVTQYQWAKLMNEWPSYFTNALARDTRPVELVSYQSIRGSNVARFTLNPDSFLGRLKALTGLEVELPTEWQWEHACRAGTQTPYNDNVASPSSATARRLMRCRDNGGGYGPTDSPDRNLDDSAGTARVGSYEPNAWGLFDMHGNVWERCYDLWTQNLGDDDRIDPFIQPSAVNNQMVIRGGCWNEKTAYCRSASRTGSNGTGSSFSSGFRVFVKAP